METDSEFSIAEHEYRSIKNGIIAAIKANPAAYARYGGVFANATKRFMNAALDLTRTELLDAKLIARVTGTIVSSTEETILSLESLHDRIAQLSISLESVSEEADASKFVIAELEKLATSTKINEVRFDSLRAEEDELRDRIAQRHREASVWEKCDHDRQRLELSVRKREEDVSQLVEAIEGLRFELSRDGESLRGRAIELDRLERLMRTNALRISAMRDEVFMLDSNRSKLRENTEHITSILTECDTEISRMRGYRVDEFVESTIDSVGPSSDELEKLEREVKLLRLERNNSFKR
jgi:SMC interacting uncharacterized protein involved in chromosome segregation